MQALKALQLAQNADVCRVLDPRRSRLRHPAKVVASRLRPKGYDLLLVDEDLLKDLLKQILLLAVVGLGKYPAEVLNLLDSLVNVGRRNWRGGA